MNKRFILIIAMILGLAFPAWATVPEPAYSWPNGFGYTPSQTAEGTTNWTATNQSQGRIDAVLGASPYFGGNSSISGAVTAISSTVKTLRIPAGAWPITADLVIPLNITLKPERGAIITIANGATLTINGPLEAGLYQIFSYTGTGKVDLSGAKIQYVYPEWWYASGDYSVAIKAAIDSRPTAISNPVFMTGPYTCNTEILTDRHGVSLHGPAGQMGCAITFTHTPVQTLFKAKLASAATVNYFSLKNLYLTGASASASTYINLVDASHPEIENVRIADTSGNGDIGLQLNGREFIRLSKFTANIDRPIVIAKNPNTSIDLDNGEFVNIDLITNATAGKGIEVATGLNISNTSFPNVSVSKGAYGFYWLDTTSSAISEGISFGNFRFEQNTADGYVIYLSHNTAVQRLKLDDCSGGGQNGFYFRKVEGSMRSCKHYGTTAGAPATPYTAGKGLDLDTVIGEFVIENFTNVNGQSAAGGAVNGIKIGGGAVEAVAFGMNVNSYAYGTPMYAIYTPTTDASLRSIARIAGVVSAPNLTAFTVTTPSTPAVPATTVEQANTNAYPVRVTVTGGTVTVIAIGPTGATVATGATTGAFILQPGHCIKMTFSVAPTWAWAGM